MDSAKKFPNIRFGPPASTERKIPEQPKAELSKTTEKPATRSESVQNVSVPATLLDILVSPSLSVLNLIDTPTTHTQVVPSNLGYEVKEQTREQRIIHEAKRRTSDALFKDCRKPPPKARVVGRKVVGSAPDSNFEFTDAQKLHFREVTRANNEAEQLALSGLSEQEVSRYNRIRGALFNEPDATLALELMLFKGQFSVPTDATGRSDLLKSLDQVLWQPMNLSDDTRLQLLTELVREIADPSCIDQQDRNTCAAASASIMLAATYPGDYVRMVVELASPQEQTLFKSGKILHRYKEPESNHGLRSYSQFLLIPALMDFAKHHQYKDAKESGGLERPESKYLLENMFGRPFEMVEFDKGAPLNVDGLRRFLTGKNLFRGNLMHAALRWEDGWHAVAIFGLVGNKGHEFVEYMNPWGTVEQLPLEEFAKDLGALRTDELGAAQRLGLGGSVTSAHKTNSTPQGAHKPTS